MVLSLWPFVFAVAFGMGVSLVGAVVPAWRAGRVSPLEGMDRVSREDLSGVPSLYYEVGLILVLIGAILTTLTVRGFVPVDVGIGGGIVLLIGMVFLQPFFLAPGSRGVTWGLRQFWRVTAGLALRQVLRHRPRSALTIGVLFVAGAAGTALSCSILDNVRDVEVWYKQAIVGDFFVRAMLPDMGNFESANLPDGLREVLEKVPGVRTLEGVSWKEGHVGESTVIVVARDLATDPAFDVVAGDRQQVRTQMLAGQVVVGSVVAQRMNLTVGGTLDLETQMGKVQLPICAVVNDYMAGGLSVVMSRGTAEKLLALDGYDAFVVRAPRENHASVREQLQKICDDHGVLLHSYAEVTGVIDGMVKGIDGFLWGLVVLIFIVASFGIVNTLTMSVLEQTRELGLLRIVAMTKRQVRSTIIIQSLIMSLVGFAPGIAAGVGFAYIINLAMPAALGHPIEFGFHPWLLLVTLLSALAVTSMAAWIPARRAANLDLVTALHYE
jgi:putative ABC transport system permease protein